MNNNYLELEELCGIPGISGNEEQVIEYLVNNLKQWTDNIHVDYSGNLTATFRGRKNPETDILIFAHMDEVGMLVRRITEDGYVLFERLGGPDEKSFRSHQVDITTENGTVIRGLVGTKSHHYTADDEKYTVPGKYDSYIDVGASSKQEVLDMGINIGDSITYTPNFNRIGKNRVVSKTLDKRACVYCIVRLAEYLSEHQPDITVHCGFSVQEEFNIRGSLPMVERLQPDMVVSMDCAIGCDTPDLYGRYELELGKGPSICIMNTYGKGPSGGLIPNPKFRKYIQKIAVENNIPYQKEISAGCLSDASFVQMKGTEGTVTAHIGIPLRYAHSPAEVVDLRDIEDAIRLIEVISTSPELTSKEKFKLYYNFSKSQ